MDTTERETAYAGTAGFKPLTWAPSLLHQEDTSELLTSLTIFARSDSSLISHM